MKRRRSLLLVAAPLAAALLIGGVGLAAVVLPQRAHAHRLAGRIAAAQAEVGTLEAARAGAPRASAVQLYQLARAMPSRDDVPGILLALDRLAGASGVTLLSVKPAPSVALPDGASAVPATVIVGGRYAQVVRFLRAIRQQVRSGPKGVVAAGRLFVVDGVDVVLDKGSSVSATLQLNAFDYGTAPVAPTAAGTPTGTTTTTTAPSGAQAVGAAP